VTLGAVTRRRIYFSVAAAIAFVAVAWLQADYAAALHRPQFFDGWVLLTGVVFLTLFNLRKKLPMLPLGSARNWTRVHVYTGYFIVGVFLLHTGAGLPQGALDKGLWFVFLTVALSGVVGLILSRIVPLRLGEARERILLERIPGFRQQLAREVADIAQRSVSEEGSLTISSFYAETIHDFMQGPRNFLGHVAGSHRALIAISAGIDRLERYVDAQGMEILAQIRERVIAKNDLDFQYSNLMLLRLWLFFHIPATYGLIIMAAVHVFAVYAFNSGAS
jgi:hypothetical protein